MSSGSNYKSFNGVQLIRDRCVRSNQRARKQLELLCEDKVSKYKLEEVHCSLPSSIKSTFIMTFSPDGQRVASTHGDHRIYICDLNTGNLLDTLEGHPKTPWCLAWHPSNREILASGCLAGEVRVWDLRSKACESWTSENHTIITSLDFHPKERVLVVATANDIHFWDWSESEPFAKSTTTHDREKVKFVVFDSSGTKLITGISNLPKLASYSSDSLQNRIIDGYLSHGGSLEQVPADNMTQNSEITSSPIVGTNKSNENISEPNNSTSSSPARRLNPSLNNNNISSTNNGNADSSTSSEQDMNYRNTLLLSRVAFLYRQLEALEDSMRHISFTPIINLRTPVNPSVEPSTDAVRIPDCGTSEEKITAPPTQNTPNQAELNSSNQVQSSSATTPTPNSFEPFLVTFDEALEQLQLPPLIIDGREVNLGTVIDQYPVDLSRQLQHAMQFESINQVNQNFIRISKLMSSARLYRQVVQQILASSTGRVPNQPNQLLTAQSVSPRSPRHSSNLPIVLRNFPIGNNYETTDSSRTSRSHDPILAIEFRNTARNVPLTTICKIDLIAARALCILRSQNLVEQALSNSRNPLTVANSQGTSKSINSHENQGSNNNTIDRSDESIFRLLGQLHSTLTTINHAPLTTSNAYTHITSLRMLLEKLNKISTALLNCSAEGSRLNELMHNIAFSLTGRRWTVPIGATLDEIRLDVIHTLCITDLTLHFVRQIQLLQMQRISLLARIEESGSHNTQLSSTRPLSAVNIDTSDKSRTNNNQEISMPGTSSECQGSSKRKSSDPRKDNKRMRVNELLPVSQAEVSMDSESIDLAPRPSSTAGTIQSGVNSDPTAADRMVIWNSPQSQIEQSLHRLFVATTSSMNNNHILVRVYHRLHGVPPFPASSSHALLESSSDRVSHSQLIQMESRRRAVSQDNSSNQQESTDHMGGAAEVPSTRPRIRPPATFHVNLHTSGSSYPPHAGVAVDAWQRHPHLHVYQTRGSGQHLWFNQWTIPLPVNSTNFRLQCWNFSRNAVPNIEDSQLNVITKKCRIHNNSSVDLSSNGSLIACLVPRDDGPCFDLKIFSLKVSDLGTCYYKLPLGPNAISVSLSPSGMYAVVGLANYKSMSFEQNEDSMAIGKVFKLSESESFEFIRDIKIKRDDSSLSLNAIKWMPRGITYNVGPQHHPRYGAARMRNVVAS